MTELVVCLGTGKGTWAHVAKLISEQEWEKIFLISSFAKEKFKVQKPHEFIEIDTEKPLKLVAEQLVKSLEGKIKGTEVALNMISGTGKEHMAILAALLRLGVGIRMVTYTGDSVEEI